MVRVIEMADKHLEDAVPLSTARPGGGRMMAACFPLCAKSSKCIGDEYMCDAA